MTHFNLKTLALAAATLFAASATAQSTQRALHFQTSYGDSMGQVSQETPTRKVEYLYGANNQLLRRVVTGAMENSDQWILTNYCRYDYNTRGQVEQTNSLQYGIYDQDEMGFKAANDTITYEYNEKGQLVKETEKSTLTYHVYTYDAEGRRVTDARWKFDKYGTKAYKNDLTLTYSDFTLGGPQTITATATASYNQYSGTITYDAAGNKTSEKHWSVAESPVLKSAEYWTYTDGVLSLYEKKGISGGQEIDGTKIEYEQLDANNIRQKTYTYGNGKWTFKAGSTTVCTYDEFEGEYNATTLSVEQDKNVETSVNLTWDLPNNYYLKGDVSFNIYRNGLLLTEKSLKEVMNQGKCCYTDTMVSNGVHEYFVQVEIPEYTYSGTSYTKTFKGYNISNIASIELYRNLPVATGLHAVSAYIDENNSYVVTVEWTNPTFTKEMGFKATHIMRQGWNSPFATVEDPNVTTAEVNFSIDPVLTFYVQTQYKTGRYNSKPVTIDASKFFSGAEDEQSATKLRVVETWGDVMGDTYGQCSKKAITYYGPDDRVLREANYAKQTDSNEWNITEYTRYIYGESGMLEKTYTQNYGRYYYGEMGFKAATDTTYYEFNLEGLMTLKYSLISKTSTSYEYDDSGNLIKTVTTEPGGNGDNVQTIEYSDFAAKDKPRYTVSTGNLNSYKWTLTTDYDADHRKTQARSTKYSSGKQVPNQLEKWIYDEEGNLVADSVYTIKVSGETETYTVKSVILYTPETNNPNRVEAKKYVWDNILGKFSNPKTWNVYEYAEIKGSLYAPTLTASPVANKLNAVLLTVEVPEDLQNPMTAFNVYRNGIEIGHAINYFDENHYTTDDYGMNGVWTYLLERQPNGDYDYFVEYAKLDNTMENIASVSNISNIVTQSYNLELPVATNLREIERRENTTTATDDDGSTLVQRNVFVTLAWDAPKNIEDLGFKRYNVMLTSSQIAENDEEAGLATTYEVALRGREEIEVYIQCVYDLGRSNGQTLVLNENGTIGTGLQTISNLTLQFYGKTLNLSAPANVSVYATDGTLIDTATQTQQLNLNHYYPGTYILLIEHEGHIAVKKVRL